MENGYLSVFRIHYSYGIHHLNLDVDSLEFERVINSLSSEFEIITEEEIWDSNDYPDFVCKQTYYFIIDYCGNKYQVGDIFERKLKL